MYVFLLWLHSVTRWLVVMGGLAAIVVAIWGLSSKRQWSGVDRGVGVFFTSIFGLQVVVGLILYFIGPWGIRAFGLIGSESDARVQAIFFSLYHIVMMLIALVVAQLGYSRGKRAETPTKAFRTALIGYGVGFLLVFLAIPWGIRPNWPIVSPF